jgi:pyridoxamine 5'-phosphate oxidase
MDMQEVFAFASQNPVTWLATVEDGMPHVRGMLLWFADETGFYFHTASIKPLAAQVARNGAVEAAFHNAGGGKLGESRMLRVSGTAEIVADPALEERLYRERPWVLANRQAMAPGTTVVIFRIRHGNCRFWDMASNGHEREAPRISF